MAVDPYALCPCGSGKKLKFCCFDVVGDIEKIHRMIEGDQPRAALRHAEQTLAEHPNRASLLDLKATLELSLDETESARKTIDHFLKQHADNASAHACQAILLSQSGGDPRAAVQSLQRAIALVDRDMPNRVFEALGAVGQALLVSGNIMAAQAHLWLYASIAPHEENRAYELLVGLNHYGGVHVLLRDHFQLRKWPEDAPWRDEATEATLLAGQGKWQLAVEIIDRLGTQFGIDPSLIYNRALLGGLLADERALVAGLHFFSQMEGVPLDDAVEAEAIAQLLDPDIELPHYDTVVQSYEIKELEPLVERLASDGRVKPFDWREGDAVDPAQPRPRHSYLFLDRPVPASGKELQLDEVPRLIGMITIYGRQTDRSERMELIFEKNEQFESTIAAVRALAGDLVGDLAEERREGHVSPADRALNLRFHFPSDTPPEVRRRIVREGRRAGIVDRWAALPNGALGGKTPREVSRSPEFRIPLMAAIMILENGIDDVRAQESISELRSSLGLESPPEIPASTPDVRDLPLARIGRLDVKNLSDDDLTALYRRALLANAKAATYRLAGEVVARPSLSEKFPPQETYRKMIVAESDPDHALRLMDEARDRAVKDGQSTAIWDIAELELHIKHGNAEAAKSALQKIEQKHLDDPQVAAAVYRLLYESGVIPQDSLMEPADDELTMAGVPAAGDVPGRIWTPESDRPSGGKSALWTPS